PSFEAQLQAVQAVSAERGACHDADHQQRVHTSIVDRGRREHLRSALPHSGDAVKCRGKDGHMSDAQQHPITIQHRVRPMTGRDPDEQHRVATPLELLFDLTFVIAFGIAANEFAHMLAENHVGAGLLGFALATFSVCWAWINFSWFASAYDTDDSI